MQFSVLSHRIGYMRARSLARCMSVFMPRVFLFIRERTSLQSFLCCTAAWSPWRRREPSWLMDSQWNIVRFMLVQLLVFAKLNFCTARRWQSGVFIYSYWFIAPGAVVPVCVFLQNHCLHREKTPSVGIHATRGEFNLHINIKRVKSVFFYILRLPKITLIQNSNESARQQQGEFV